MFPLSLQRWVYMLSRSLEIQRSNRLVNRYKCGWMTYTNIPYDVRRKRRFNMSFWLLCLFNTALCRAHNPCRCANCTSHKCEEKVYVLERKGMQEIVSMGFSWSCMRGGRHFKTLLCGNVSTQSSLSRSLRTNIGTKFYPLCLDVKECVAHTHQSDPNHWAKSCPVTSSLGCYK